MDSNVQSQHQNQQGVPLQGQDLGQGQRQGPGPGLYANAAGSVGMNGAQEASSEPTEEEQVQYKIQLLLHINSILLARVIQMTQNKNAETGGTASLPDNLKLLASQYLKRVHANLQCISQVNQGIKKAKPIILEPPQPLVQQPAQDILVKLYLLMSRVFEIW
ncbi:hypothetical protein HG535_0B01440 [Zygotorulaspora mrakii]|uniref:Uncharacterized protein n=1 Tax=Zygotorulaspora mrakii TaxID=42260 RepID=A0A7H9AXY4_ZYGMR|nr:uncharacterized protein HG535_0B01440 [Zygotorulaspora mrakii]QLG71106.1 hypothetical protein HG535_0B01440 [Zygotorulaspora mrakii]